jgi:hypothetical protein
MEDLIRIAVGLLVPVVLAVVVHHLVNSRPAQATVRAESCVVAYGTSLKVILGVMTLIAAVLIGIGLIEAPEGWRMALGVAAFFALWLIPLYLEFFRVRIVATGEGLQCRSPWRAARQIRWDEIQSVDFSYLPQWYRIRTRGKGIVRLPVFLSGLDTLFDLVHRKAGIRGQRP